jgi:hypothetical protein
MDGHVHKEALNYFDYSQKDMPLIVGYRPHSLVTIKPEELIVFKTQTIKKFIYSVIEEDWDLIENDNDVSLETFITNDVRQVYLRN